MSVFGSYARYYDLLYRDKDYVGETDYLVSLLGQYAPEAQRLLELGCGTGRHAELLAGRGFDVTGIDQSEQMVAQARTRNPELQFHHGDIRDIRLEDEFDAVLALFHVMSYQTENSHLRAALRTARAHLRLGGVFIFDCWHGPAVLSQRPEVRVKRLSDENIRVIRIAEPELCVAENRVRVGYDILVQKDQRWDEHHEVHEMRYLFQPEVEMLLEDSDMRLLRSEEWMSGAIPDSNTWGVVHIAVAT